MTPNTISAQEHPSSPPLLPPPLHQLIDRFYQQPPSHHPIIHQLVSFLILNPTTNLLSIIQANHPQLTSSSPLTRARANHLLVQLISSIIHLDILSTDQVLHLLEFFIQKLGDHPSVLIEALAGLSSLSSSKDRFPPQLVIRSCQALFQHIPHRDLDQPKRLAVLILIDHLLAHHRPVLKAMGLEFLLGYRSLVEGEKDPRNLIVVFKLSRVILTEFELADQVQNFFDITFCYFPITFRPLPSGNPVAYAGITTEELIQGLIDCLASTPHFAIFVLPLLLDKFQAPGSATKVQVLQTIIQAFPIYGQAAVAEFAPLFWESFLVECPLDLRSVFLSLLPSPWSIPSPVDLSAQHDPQQTISNPSGFRDRNSVQDRLPIRCRS